MRFFYNSLIYKLALVFVIAAILPFGLSAILFSMQEMSVLETHESKYDQKLVDIADNKIDNALSTSLVQMKLLAKSYALAHENLNDDDLLDEIRRVVDSNPYIDDITALDTEGQVLTSVYFDYSGSWTSKSWYLNAAKGEITFSPAYMRVVIPECLISLNVPVNDGNHVKMVLSANINLGSLWDDMLKVDENDEAYFVLTNKEGRIIRHPRGEYLLEKFPDNAVNDLLARKHYGRAGYSSGGVQKNFYVKHVSSRFPEADFGWNIVFFRETAEAGILHGAILKSVMGIFSLVLIFIVTISVVFARRVTKPIQAVTSAAEQIADGDYNISLAVSSTDEIGILSKTINEMASKLQLTTMTRNELAGEVMYYEQIEKQLKVAKKKAEDANKAKDDLLACVSHEVRTPLNAIMGYTESLMIENDNPQYNEKLRTILNESEHLLCLLNDVLDNAKIQSGRLDIELQPCDLKQTLKSVKQLMQPKAASKDLAFSVQHEDMPAYVITDQLRLRQVILNLLSNAIKFTNSGKVVLAVNAEALDEHYTKLKFSVTDTGIGISKEKQDSIFDSYIQADSSISRNYGGTGLGTTISKNIVGLMGGQMGLESTEGVGSTFWFELPMKLCSQEQIDAIKKETSVARDMMVSCNFDGAKVLLVEDYLTNQNLIISQLGKLNIVCDLAEHGRQAVDMAKEREYDIILMDLQMPVMDGITATRLIRSMKSPKNEVPVIAMTASVEQEIKNECYSAGMSDIVCKPLKIAKLAAVIEKWLDDSLGSAVNTGVNEDSGKSIESGSDNSMQQEQGTPWDKKLALELFGDNEMLLNMSIKNYITDVDSLITQIESAVNTKDFDFICTQAHKIKGGAACIAADGISQHAGKLEDMAKNSVDDGMLSILNNLRSEFEGLKSQADI